MALKCVCFQNDDSYFRSLGNIIKELTFPTPRFLMCYVLFCLVLILFFSSSLDLLVNFKKKVVSLTTSTVTMVNYREYQQIIKLDTRPSRISRTPSASPYNKCMNEECNVQKPRKKITRTKTGCYCCRRRKKKCDERKPVCSGCLRNMLHCVYPTPEEIEKSIHRRRKRASSKEVSGCRKFYRILPKTTSTSQSNVSSACSIDNILGSKSFVSPPSSATPSVGSPASSSMSSPGSPYSDCSSNGINAYITPVSSPKLCAYTVSPQSENYNVSSVVLQRPQCPAPVKRSVASLEVKNLLN